jgi:hypothetical protein
MRAEFEVTNHSRRTVSLKQSLTKHDQFESAQSRGWAGSSSRQAGPARQAPVRIMGVPPTKPGLSNQRYSSRNNTRDSQIF